MYIFILFFFQISETDGLSSLICSSCLTSTTNYHTFYKQVRKSQEMIASFQCLRPEPTNFSLLLDDENRDHFRGQNDADIPNQSLQMIELEAYDSTAAAPMIDCNADIYDHGLNIQKIENVSFECLPLPSTSTISGSDVGTSILLDISNNLQQPQVGLQPLKEYQCSECDKKFIKKDKFRRHMLIHRPALFPCNLCSRKFNTKKKRSLHEVIHKKEKPFRCDICDSSFCKKQSLNIHKLKLHNTSKNQEQFDMPSSPETRALESSPLPSTSLRTNLHSVNTKATNPQTPMRQSLTTVVQTQKMEMQTPVRVSHTQYSVFRHPSNAAGKYYKTADQQQQQNDLVSLETRCITYTTPMRSSEYAHFKQPNNSVAEHSTTTQYNDDDHMSLESPTTITHSTPLQHSRFKRPLSVGMLSNRSTTEQDDQMSLCTYQSPMQSTDCQCPVFQPPRSRTADGKLCAVINAVSALYNWSQSLN